MITIAVLFRAELRHRWRSWLLLGILVALVSGLVMAGLAAGRRTASAYPRFVDAYGFDAGASTAKPIPKIDRLPNVSAATLLVSPAAGTPTCSCGHPINRNDFDLTEITPSQLGHFVKLVSGRMPDQRNPHEVLASFAFERAAGVRVGSHIEVPLYSALQQREIQTSARPKGPTVTLTVVGIEAAAFEFESSGSPFLDLYTTKAFANTYNSKTVSNDVYFVRLRHGAADLPRFELGARDLGAVYIDDLDTTKASNEASIHPQAVGWWLLAGVIALVGTVFVAQALTRQAIVSSDPFPTLSALGVSRRQLIWLGMARTLAITLTGMVGGLAVAVLVSPLAPVGEARIAEPSTGFAFDSLILITGAVVTVLVILLVGLRPAFSSARWRRDSMNQTGPSQIIGILGRLGAPPSALIGVGRAVDRGGGLRAVPVASAISGVTLSVIALSATLVFGASLSHLISTPSLYGQPFDAYFTASSTPTSTRPSQIQKSILGDAYIKRVTEGIMGDVAINGKTVESLGGESLRGQTLFTATTGRLPSRPDEVTLGASTLRSVKAHVGSVVRVTVPNTARGTLVSKYRVVGTSAFPPDFGAGGLGTGAIFSFRGLLAAQCAPGPTRLSCEAKAGDTVLLVRADRSAAGQHALATLAAKYSSDVQFGLAPNDLVNFGQAVNFPLILSFVILLFGAAALQHVLFVSVVRRSRESGVLKTIGFTRRQVALTVLWQSVTITVIGTVVGVPVGMVVGRLTWRLFAENLGVVPIPIVVGWTMGAVALGALALAALLGVWPATLALRAHSAKLLRGE